MEDLFESASGVSKATVELPIHRRWLVGDAKLSTVVASERDKSNTKCYYVAGDILDEKHRTVSHGMKQSWTIPLAVSRFLAYANENHRAISAKGNCFYRSVLWAVALEFTNKMCRRLRRVFETLLENAIRNDEYTAVSSDTPGTLEGAKEVLKWLTASLEDGVFPDDDAVTHRSIDTRFWGNTEYLLSLLVRNWHVPYVRTMLEIPAGNQLDQFAVLMWHSCEESAYVPMSVDRSMQVQIICKEPGTEREEDVHLGPNSVTERTYPMHLHATELWLNTNGFKVHNMGIIVFCSWGHFEPIVREGAEEEVRERE